MKKIVLILTIVLCVSANAYSQYYASKDNHNSGGLFSRGLVSDEEYYGAGMNRQGLMNNNTLPRLPIHNMGGDQPAPLGGGGAVLTFLCAAYFVSKKRREE